jgi:hypothetical protein
LISLFVTIIDFSHPFSDIECFYVKIGLYGATHFGFGHHGYAAPISSEKNFDWHFPSSFQGKKDQ